MKKSVILFTGYLIGVTATLFAQTPGTQKWAFTTGDDVRSSPAIGSDGTIYVGSYDNKLYAINPDGTQKWAFTTGDDVFSSPAIGSDGTIYVGSRSYDNKLYAINPDGTQKWAFTTGSAVSSSPAVGSDGTIYVGSWDNKLYAIYSSSLGLAQSPWPKFHQNNQNTGKRETIVVIVDQVQFNFFNIGETIEKTFQVSNLTSQSITLKSCVFDNDTFSLNTTLPITIPAGSSSTLTASIQPDSTRLYQSTCQLTYEIEGETKTSSGQISAGLFLDDDSELAYTAHQALPAYNTSKAQDAASVATTNNLGVLYRLLGEPNIAEQTFLRAVNKGLNASYGYGGIKMNIGVIKSDQGQSSGADEYYGYALEDVSVTESTSALAPQVYYNQAWEAYANDDLSGTLDEVNKTVDHSMVNDFLQAKAFVLRGALFYRMGDVSGARDDFQQALSLDPNGPIGRMAQENFDLLVSVEEPGEENIPRVFVLMPNYPNPFNPETTVSFGLPKGSDVELVIYNVLGQKIRTLVNRYVQAGWHNITWDGSDDSGNSVASGVYLLQMKAATFGYTHKMTLLR